MNLNGPLLAAVLFAVASEGPWEPQPSGTTARFRGVSVAKPQVAWASGTGGTFARTVDGGQTWRAGVVPGAEALDFRDVQAVDEQTAYLLSIGEGEMSRILKTVDGGASWTTQYTNRDPKGFLDALAFWDADHGLALGDPVDGRFTILATEDGGRTWTRPAVEGMPPALAGEGAFAASGTCLAVGPGGRAWFGTGGGVVARVFRSTDRGRTWTPHATPLRAGAAAAGVFSVAFRGAEVGVVVGGDYQHPDEAAGNVALTVDGGQTWVAPAGRPGGYRSAVAFGPVAAGPALVTVGPTGSDRSDDGGQTWRPLGPIGFHAVGFAGPGGVGWAVGDGGRIARFRPEGSGRD